MKVDIIKMHPEVILPAYETIGSAGMDIRYFASRGDRHNHPNGFPLYPNTVERLGTGIKVSVPQGYELQVRSRSGLAYKGIIVVNAPGTIDSDFRGEIGLLMLNTTDSLVYVQDGDRMAQLVLAPVFQASWNLVEELGETVRGSNGFGHTGTS